MNLEKTVQSTSQMLASLISDYHNKGNIAIKGSHMIFFAPSAYKRFILVLTVNSIIIAHIPNFKIVYC